ncbi:aminotransferase [Gracilibacillus sp. YIM 98692]|uniref:aminotransferase n=1 Tax=Gracilibacillus sp. YIM 98692 TaxID=2663532 RepID=UPI0013D08706|nr:aminotransferase [Gracilibacillus sp. YIM 98692]
MSTSYLAKNVENLKPSGIRKFFDLASKMDNVISLGVGEPDFVTPWNVIEASYHSLEKGYTAYTANAGLMELREAISDYLNKTFSISYEPESQVLVTVGASQAIDLALRAVVDPEDEVLIVEPCFVSYGPAISLAGGIPVPISAQAKNEFKITPEQIEEAVTEKTKAIVLCSPNNPTGTVLNQSELEEVSSVICKHDLLVISDEIYAELSYDDQAASIASINGMTDRTVVISGFSKSFAMTGWRLGYAVGPTDIIRAMTKIHQYTMMCAPTMAQHGALEALRNGNDSVMEMKTSYRQRRNLVVKALNEMGLSCHLPGGAFYVFPSIRETGLSSETFAQKLLEEEGVAVVPGHVFGESGEGYIRCSYATSIKQLDEAMKRMNRFVEKHT